MQSLSISSIVIVCDSVLSTVCVSASSGSLRIAYLAIAISYSGSSHSSLSYASRLFFIVFVVYHVRRYCIRIRIRRCCMPLGYVILAPWARRHNHYCRPLPIRLFAIVIVTFVAFVVFVVYVAVVVFVVFVVFVSLCVVIVLFWLVSIVVISPISLASCSSRVRFLALRSNS